MNEDPPSLAHERLLVVRGERSELPVIVAVHSTVLGMAVGGCRLWHYGEWREGLDDALRLSHAMTMKCALAGLPHGGGKAVIPLPEDLRLTPERRRAVFLDLGDAVGSLGGIYGTGEDVGTTAEDMLIARERTRYAYCLPVSSGGVGEPSEPTAVGVLAALRVVLKHLFGSGDAAGRHLTIIGLGQVGSRLARALSEQGATMAVTDIDPSKKELAGELGALWLEPEDALGTETDVLVPAALGGILTAATVDDLRCRAIAGPANNQLSEPQVAERLAARGILWAPDFLVNAGGAIYGTMVDIAQAEHEKTMDKVAAIGETLSRILDAAEREGTTTLAAASRLAENRIETARRAREERAPRSLASVHPRRN